MVDGEKEEDEPIASASFSNYTQVKVIEHCKNVFKNNELKAEAILDLYFLV